MDTDPSRKGILLKAVGCYLGLAAFGLIMLAGVAHEFDVHWFDFPAGVAVLAGFVVWIIWMVTDAIKNRTVGTMLLVWCLWIFVPGIIFGLLGLLGPIGRFLYLFLIPPWIRD
jgi:hypothetical protein